MFLALLLILVFYFNPRPPRGERLGDKVPVIVKAKISIHALREESDAQTRRINFVQSNISIHALREESDIFPDTTITQEVQFQSTPSARRATLADVFQQFHKTDFNPRPPRGERQQKQRKNPMLLFHYTHLCTI